jgi:SAM-dependent methyltransferase
MYRKSIKYYDALYHFKDYASGVERLVAIIQKHNPSAQSFLDVACGTGKHLELLRSRYYVEGVDIEAGLLEQAHRRLPGILLHQADMRHFALKRTFDVVACLFSSITYLKTLDNLRQGVLTLARHVAPGGLLLIDPLYPPESYWEGRVTMNTVDWPNLKIVWMYVSEREDRIARHHQHFMVGTPDGIEIFDEVHELGLFTDSDYREAFSAAGLQATYDEIGPMGRGLYIAKHGS